MTKESGAFVEAFFFLNFYKNNVVTNLTDTVPGNGVFIFPSKKIVKFTRAGNDECSHAACFAVEFNVYGTAQTAAGAGVDYFFLF